MVRRVVGALVVAAVGIHCSVAAEPTGLPSSPAPAVAGDDGDDGDGARPSPAPPPAPSAPDEGSAAPPVGPDLTSLLHEGAPPLVTSSVRDATGATYVTGTFVGAVGIGNTVMKSRGDKDVFLLKLAPAGAFAWVRAVGSASMESAPRVTLEGASVTVVGMTKGEMDCGSGPLPTWSSDTFFLCTFGGLDGATESGGVFPTGSP